MAFLRKKSHNANHNNIIIIIIIIIIIMIIIIIIIIITIIIVMIIIRICILTINQSLGAYAKRLVASPALRRQLWRSPRKSSHACPFPYQLTPNRKHRLYPAMNFVGAPLASSTPGYPFQKQPEKQDQLLGNVPQCHMPI